MQAANQKFAFNKRQITRYIFPTLKKPYNLCLMSYILYTPTEEVNTPKKAPSYQPNQYHRQKRQD